MVEVNIRTPQEILSNAFGFGIKKAMKSFTKDGVEVEKGAIITPRRIEKYRDLYEKYFELWTLYPDIFLDTVKPRNSHFNFYFYQRYFLRLCMRYERICVIAPRAFGKSFISILAMYVMCIFRPGIKLFICAPKKGQSAKIAREKIFEIWQLFPLLKKEILGDGNFSGDYVRLTFRNGSVFDVVTALDSQRGGRRQAGQLDEYRF